MNLLDFIENFMRRTSQFTFNDWLLVFACFVLASYTLLLARR